MNNRPKIKNSTILVTGGAGFIGSHLVDKLLLEGAKEVIVVDNLFVGSEENLKDAILKGVILYKDDIEISSHYLENEKQIGINFSVPFFNSELKINEVPVCIILKDNTLFTFTIVDFEDILPFKQKQFPILMY